MILNAKFYLLYVINKYSINQQIVSSTLLGELGQSISEQACTFQIALIFYFLQENIAVLCFIFVIKSFDCEQGFCFYHKNEAKRSRLNIGAMFSEGIKASCKTRVNLS